MANDPQRRDMVLQALQESRLDAFASFSGIEPAIYLDRVGRMRHCDVVAWTHNGAEVPTDF